MLSLIERETGAGASVAGDAATADAAVRRRAGARAAARLARRADRRSGAAAARPGPRCASGACRCSTDEQKTVVRLALEETIAGRTGRQRSRRCGRACGSRRCAATTPSATRVQATLERELGFKPADEPLRRRGGPGWRAASRAAFRRRSRCRCAPTSGRTPPPRSVLARAARGDRGQPRGHDRGPRQRVPARPPSLGAALPRGAARAQGRVPAARARPLPRRVPLAPAGDRRRPRPRRPRARVRRDARARARAHARRPRAAARRAARATGERARPAGPRRCAPSGRDAAAARRGAAFLGSARARPTRPSGPTPPRPIGEVAGERIRKVYRRMVRMGAAIDESSPAEEYHELRKKGKELRYLLELFGAPLYPGEVVKPMIKTLKAPSGRARPPPGPRGAGGAAAIARTRGRRDTAPGGRALMAIGRADRPPGRGRGRRARRVRGAVRRVRSQGAATTGEGDLQVNDSALCPPPPTRRIPRTCIAYCCSTAAGWTPA